jgi:hypothetical protein
LTPAFAIKIGESAIRNCFAHQLTAIREEGTDKMGIHPCLFSEIGIPYDMDDKYAYKTGNYSSQIAALDANHFALEQSHASGFALWCYTVNVSFVCPYSVSRHAHVYAEQPLLGRPVEWGRSLHLLGR